MTVVDERGRVFGRVNVIDAFIALVVLVIVPLVYGAFLLFHPPVPEILAVVPGKLAQHERGTLQVTGRNLRPYLLAYVGAQRSEGWFILSPTQAEVKVPAMEPGTYDLVIFDEAQELARKPMAVVIGQVSQTVAHLRVRFLAAPELLPFLTDGKRDVPELVAGVAVGGGAVLTSIPAERHSVTVNVLDYAADRTYGLPQAMEEFVAEVGVPVVSHVSGWAYKSRVVKVGSLFRFEAAEGMMLGTVLQMNISTEGSAP